MQESPGRRPTGARALASASLPRPWAIARRVTGDHDTAEDAVQDCLLRAWRDLRALREPDRFEAWLHRLLINACRERVRSARRSAVAVLHVSSSSTSSRRASVRQFEAVVASLRLG